MQDEINEKVIALSIKTTKLTADVLQKSIKFMLSQIKKQLDKQQTPHGKQTLKQLMKQNAGVSNIEITNDNMPLVYMRREYILMLPLCYRVGKLPPYLMRLFIVHFSRLKGLYEVVGKIVSLLERLRQGKSKLNICCFIAAPERGHKHFPVCLCGILDIVKGFAQCAFNRLNLCNRHISLSTPFISSMSSW